VVQIIMLDTRFFRSPLKPKTFVDGRFAGYEPQVEGEILGNAQWNWLEQQLKKPADLRFVVSSIQLIPDDPQFEKWGNFPQERQRFFDLLKSTKTKNVIILSGDRHMASISKIDLTGYGPLYEVTGSSINRPNKYTDSDRHYLGPVYNKENFGLAQIDWAKRRVQIDIRSLGNSTVNSINIKLK
jgi:alkaline phosphatase D